jgi:hypothetical protein
MSDRVLERVFVPLPDGRWRAMSREAFYEALAAGIEATAIAPSPAGSGGEPLLDAEHAAAQLGVNGRLLDDSARAGILPHYKLGRFVRFRVSELPRTSESPEHRGQRIANPYHLFGGLRANDL